MPARKPTFAPSRSHRIVEEPLDTRARILRAAEALFVQQGFAQTSLRMITARAGVNLAAVNYHFGSKEELIREVFQRHLGPLNAARCAYLDRLEAQARGAPLSADVIVEAIVVPVLQVSRDPLKGGAKFLRLLGRALSEQADTLRGLLPEHYREVVIRFKQALVRALPHVPEAEIAWRMHFMFGAMSYALAGNDALKLIATCDAEEAGDAEAIVRRLAPFLAAGLQASPPVQAAGGAREGAAVPHRRASTRARRQDALQ